MDKKIILPLLQQKRDTSMDSKTSIPVKTIQEIESENEELLIEIDNLRKDFTDFNEAQSKITELLLTLNTNKEKIKGLLREIKNI